MADVKISALPASGALAAGDLFAVVNGGVTSKATLTQIQTGLTGAFVLKAGDIMTGTLAIKTGVAAGDNLEVKSAISVVDAAGSVRDLRFASGDTNTGYRWFFRCNATAESGADAGSDFVILNRHDNGTSNLANALFIKRSNGLIGIGTGTPNTTLSILSSVGGGSAEISLYANTNISADYTRLLISTSGSTFIQSQAVGAGVLRTLQVGTGPSNGTDIAGVSSVFNGGQSTGTGLPGAILFQQSTPAGGSGSGVNALATRWSISTAGNLTAEEGFNIAVGTATGTKIGTATSQKLSFWNKTPIIQPTNAIAAAAFVANTSGTVNDTATFGGYTIGQIAAALIATGILT